MKNYYVYIDYTKEESPRPFYVGKGNGHRVSVKTRNKLHSNIKNKYGMDRKIVFNTSSEKEAFDKEIELIAFYKTNVTHGEGHWGANFTDGGEGATGCKQSKETCQLKSELLKKAYEEGRKITPDYNGENNPFYGRKHSEDTKKKIGSKSHGRNLPVKPVIQFNKNGEIIMQFKSLKEAQEQTGIDHHCISRVCRGLNQTAGGFVWKWSTL